MFVATYPPAAMAYTEVELQCLESPGYHRERTANEDGD